VLIACPCFRPLSLNDVHLQVIQSILSRPNCDNTFRHLYAGSLHLTPPCPIPHTYEQTNLKYVTLGFQTSRAKRFQGGCHPCLRWFSRWSSGYSRHQTAPRKRPPMNPGNRIRRTRLAQRSAPTVVTEPFLSCYCSISKQDSSLQRPAPRNLREGHSL